MASRSSNSARRTQICQTQATIPNFATSSSRYCPPTLLCVLATKSFGMCSVECGPISARKTSGRICSGVASKMFYTEF